MFLPLVCLTVVLFSIYYLFPLHFPLFSFYKTFIHKFLRSLANLVSFCSYPIPYLPSSSTSSLSFTKFLLVFLSLLLYSLYLEFLLSPNSPPFLPVPPWSCYSLYSSLLPLSLYLRIPPLSKPSPFLTCSCLLLYCSPFLFFSSSQCSSTLFPTHYLIPFPVPCFQVPLSSGLSYLVRLVCSSGHLVPQVSRTSSWWCSSILLNLVPGRVLRSRLPSS